MSANSEYQEEVMCSCSGTTRKDIQGWFEQGLDLEAISRKSGALSGCGGCEWDISQFLKTLRENSSNQA